MQNNKCCTSVLTDKRGFSNIMWCILIVCLAIIMAFVLSFVLAVNIANSEKEVVEQVLDTFIDQNAVRIYSEVKQGTDYTEEALTEEYIAMLVETAGLTEISDGTFASMIDETSYRFTIRDINLDFHIANRAKVVLTYTMTVPLEFNGDEPMWVDVPLSITSYFNAVFDDEDIVDSVYTPSTVVRLPAYVIDFGSPINIDLSTRLPSGYQLISVENGVYGTTEITGVNQFRYTPTTILLDADYIEMTIADKSGTPATYAIRIYPATTVYYEESFVQWNENWTIGTAGDEYQAAEILGGHKNNYGYDDAYVSNIGASNGTQASTSTLGAQGTFTFTGTGFDLYANCDEGTGWVAVEVIKADGTTEKAYLVNTIVKGGTSGATSGQTGTFYSIPVVALHGLTHGTYTVRVTKVLDKTPINIDGVRIYDTVTSQVFQDDQEQNPTYYQLRDQVLSTVAVGNFLTYRNEEEFISDIWDKSASASAIILNQKLDYTDQDTAQDLLENGSKNELYLHEDETLAFKVSTKGLLQLGLKAPKGVTTVEIRINGKLIDLSNIKSSVDMFYELGNKTGSKREYLVTVRNTGSNLLSVTQLKISGVNNTLATTFEPLTKDDIKLALVASGYIRDTLELADDMILIDMNAELDEINMIYLGSENAWKSIFPDEEDDFVFDPEYMAIGLPDDYVIKDGDAVLYGDYCYTYNCVMDITGDLFDEGFTTEELHTMLGSTMTLKDGWNVMVLDRTKETYGKIASTLLGKPVTSMYCTFTDCQSMTKMPDVPKTVSAMGMTYAGCYSLTEITIPETVTSIGPWVFFGCWKVSDVTIPDHIVSLDTYAFGCCYSLKRIAIPKNVTHIGAYAFDELVIGADFTNTNGWYVVKEEVRIELDAADLADPKNAGRLLDALSEGEYVVTPGYCDYEWYRN